MKDANTPSEMLARVRMMASGDGKWGLSQNDLEALLYVLDEHDRLVKKVARLQASQRQSDSNE